MKSNTKNTSRFYIFFMRFIVQYRLTDDSPKFTSFYLLGIELKVHLVGQNVFLSAFFLSFINGVFFYSPLFLCSWKLNAQFARCWGFSPLLSSKRVRITRQIKKHFINYYINVFLAVLIIIMTLAWVELKKKWINNLDDSFTFFCCFMYIRLARLCVPEYVSLNNATHSDSIFFGCILQKN